MPKMLQFPTTEVFMMDVDDLKQELSSLPEMGKYDWYKDVGYMGSIVVNTTIILEDKQYGYLQWCHMSTLSMEGLLHRLAYEGVIPKGFYVIRSMPRKIPAPVGPKKTKVVPCE